MRPLPLFSVLLLAFACGGPHTPTPEMMAPPVTTVSPPPGTFNDQLTLTFTTDREATVYVSVDGADPRKTSKGRLSGPSPFKVTLTATTAVKYFANAAGKDEELHTDTWTRAGGPVGTISGVVVVGGFATGKELAVFDNFNMKRLGQVAMPAEVPFTFTGVQSGTHQLNAMMDRNGDGRVIPFIDFSSPTVSVTIDLKDPFKASAENVRLYLGASQPDLGTLRGTITLPEASLGTDLRVSALSASSFTSGFDPQTLLSQLQNGYQIFTNGTDTQYPYVITDLMPGPYVPAPVLLGFGAGGLAMNFLASPLSPAIVPAGGEAVADFEFGPVSITGTVTLMSTAAPSGVVYGVVAARTGTLGTGIQAVLMPAVFGPDSSGNLVANYGGQALKANATFAIRSFVSTSSMNPLTDALQWAINPFSMQPPDVSLPIGTQNVVQDLVAH